MTSVRGGRVQRAVALVCALLTLAAAMNAWWFTSRAASPLIVSDNWFYLDQVVYPYAHGHFSPGDLLVKRSAFDHSQPLRRALLVLNYEWFDLDFRIEAMFGAAVGALNLLLIAWLARRELRAGMPVSALAFAALAAVYLSLSATVVFTWSLLTLAFTSHLVLLLWLAMVWRALSEGEAVALAGVAAATFLMGLVADDTGLAAVLALALALCLHGARAKAWARTRDVALSVAAGWVAYLAFYRVAAPLIPPSSGMADGPGLVARLMAALPDAWTWFSVPLGSALVHRSTLRTWAGGDAELIVFAIAVLAALAHVWFWRQAFAGDRNRPAFMAVVLMLLFYGLVAALLIGRIAGRGSEYLWQPRYAMVYRWHLVALLLMVVAQAPRLAATWSARRLSWLAAPLALLLCVEAGLSVDAWQRAIYSQRWNERAARQVFGLAQDPLHAPSGCIPQLTVCRFPPERRAKLMRFLEANRMSVFSPEVRRRNGLQAVGGAGD